MLIDEFFFGTKSHHKKIKTLLKPIYKYLGTDQISYVTIDQFGQGFSITSNCKLVEDNIERGGYKYATFFVNPDNMHSGFAIDAACQDQMYQNNLYIFTTKFNWYNSFTYAEKDNNGGYFALDFATNKNNFSLFNKLINESHIIKQLIRSLHRRITTTFNNDIQERKVDFKELMGDLFYTNKGRVFNEKFASEQSNRIKILIGSGIFPNSNENNILNKLHLSAAETECMKNYYAKNSIKKVANNLNKPLISVIQNIDNIKTRLECNNDSELFEKLEILQSLGYIYL